MRDHHGWHRQAELEALHLWPLEIGGLVNAATGKRTTEVSLATSMAPRTARLEEAMARVNDSLCRAGSILVATGLTALACTVLPRNVG